jgi:hypothetical protein
MYTLTEEQVHDNVIMENELRRIINKEARKLKKLLDLHIGKKAFNGDGMLGKKIREKICFGRSYDVASLSGGEAGTIDRVWLYPGPTCLYLKVSGWWGDKHREIGRVIAAHDSSWVLTEVLEIKLPTIDAEVEYYRYCNACRAWNDYIVAKNKLMPQHRS